MSSWPLTLPQTPLLQGFKDEPQNTVLRSEMTGLNKQRNRYTAYISNVTESYWLTPVQFNTFKTFFHNTLGNGAAEFTKTDPVTNTTRTYRFTGNNYTMSFNGVDYFVTLSLEKLP